jgi:hypothetical protein
LCPDKIGTTLVDLCSYIRISKWNPALLWQLPHLFNLTFIISYQKVSHMAEIQMKPIF